MPTWTARTPTRPSSRAHPDPPLWRSTLPTSTGPTTTTAGSVVPTWTARTRTRASSPPRPAPPGWRLDAAEHGEALALRVVENRLGQYSFWTHARWRSTRAEQRFQIGGMPHGSVVRPRVEGGLRRGQVFVRRHSGFSNGLLSSGCPRRSETPMPIHVRAYGTQGSA